MPQFRPGGFYAPPVIKNLLIINVVVFLAQNILSHTETPLELYGALWGIGTGNFKIWQLVTYMFMHHDFYHILYNMFALYMFGVELEGLWGSKRFLQFYFICGIGAGLIQLLAANNGVTIGASGAVMGVLAAFAYLFPNRPLYLFFIPIPIAAKYLISGLILMDLWSGINTPASGGDQIAHFAHLGGALIGVIIVIIWNRGNRRNFY